jgi:hypothetical protein
MIADYFAYNPRKFLFLFQKADEETSFPLVKSIIINQQKEAFLYEKASFLN